jgi:hypothetical protein
MRWSLESTAAEAINHEVGLEANDNEPSRPSTMNRSLKPSTAEAIDHELELVAVNHDLQPEAIDC